ncbi:MAG: hypothetical protein RIC36_11725 [Rhodospirillales bacterium]
MLSLRRLAAFTVLLSLAACDDVPTSVVSYQESGIDSTLIATIAEGPMPVVVIGDPFNDGSVAERTLKEMSVVQIGRVIEYAQAGPDFPTGDARTFVVFNGSGAAGEAICQGQVPETTPAGSGELTLRMVFCGGSRRLSDVQGRTPNIATSGHEYFSMLLRGATRSLYREEEQ